MSADAAPLIVAALLGPQDFAWLDDLRRRHFPPERNLLAAHLTLFHHLPPSILPELEQRLKAAVRAARPAASASDYMSLGRGVALRIASPALVAIRADLADAFASLLTPQDRAGWRPHVTIQNKVAPDVARALLRSLSEGFRPTSLRIDGLAIHRYRDGPWEPVSCFRFRG